MAGPVRLAPPRRVPGPGRPGRGRGESRVRAAGRRAGRAGRTSGVRARLRHRGAADARAGRHADGTPWLVVADTAWAMPWRAVVDDVETYAADRRDKGFNAVLLMTVQPDMRATGPRGRNVDEGFEVGFEDLAEGRLDEDRRRVLPLPRPDHRRPRRARADPGAAAGVPRFRLEGPGRGRTGRPAGGVRALLPLPGGPLRRSAGGLPGRRRRGGHRAADRGRRPGGAPLGRVRAAHRYPLPAALDGQRAPGGRVAGLPVVPDRSPGRPRPRPGGPTLDATSRPGGDERRADLRGDGPAGQRRRLVAGA